MPPARLSDLFTRRDRLDPIVDPYIIAEIGVNHEGRMDLAKRQVEEAKAGGADAVKFQTYRAGTLASRHSPAYWDTAKEPTTSQYELFKRHDGFWRDEMAELKAHCDALDIEFLSTPFDLEAAGFLDQLMPAFKISSSDITNKPFIEHLCGYGKPIILSTGASALHEIQEAVEWIEPHGNPLALLHCVLNYPTAEENANLGMIRHLRQAFPRHLIGYSDHVAPGDMRVCETAVLLGSVIIEKHFTHDKTLPGNDHYHAMDKEDLKTLRAHIRRLLAIVGGFRVRALPEEAPARRNARRSLVAARDIPEGSRLRPEDVTFKRPAHGIGPRHYDELIGRRARVAIAEDTVLQWNLFDD